MHSITMKRLAALLLLFAFLASASQLSPRQFGSSKLTVQVEWVLSGGSGSGADALETFGFPTNAFQTVEYYSEDEYSTSADEWGNKRLRFEWPSAQSKTVSLLIEAGVDYSNGLSSASIVNEAYLEGGEFVVLDVAALAQSELIAGSADSGFEKAVLLTDWVHNKVEYDESFWDDEYASDFVLEERRGVCNEESHLLIALLRSQGIPARFVAGFVYSGEVWGPHAWVEAAIDDYWVPLDPTFNEAGVLDATHLKFAHAPDQSSIIEEITSGLVLTKPALQVTVQESQEFNLPFTIKQFKAPELVGPGALGEARAIVQSLSSRDQAVPLYLTVPRTPVELAVTVVGDEDALVFLPAGSQRTHSWSMVFPEALEEGYYYNFTILLESLGESDSFEVQGRADADAPIIESIEIDALSARFEEGAVTVTAEVSNQGNTGVNAFLNCSLNGYSDESMVALEVGDSRLVQFVFEAQEEGEALNGVLVITTPRSTITQPFNIFVPEAPVIEKAGPDFVLLSFLVIGVLLLATVATAFKKC